MGMSKTDLREPRGLAPPSAAVPVPCLSNGAISVGLWVERRCDVQLSDAAVTTGRRSAYLFTSAYSCLDLSEM